MITADGVITTVGSALDLLKDKDHSDALFLHDVDTDMVTVGDFIDTLSKRGNSESPNLVGLSIAIGHKVFDTSPDMEIHINASR